MPHLAEGTLRFFGDWFGRPWDNFHRIVEVESTADTLILHFDQEERLTVWSPVGVTANQSALRIHRAARVRWEWYWYGRPIEPENLVYLDYSLRGDEVAFETDFMPDKVEPDTDAAAPAVEMLDAKEHFKEAMGDVSPKDA